MKLMLAYAVFDDQPLFAYASAPSLFSSRRVRSNIVDAYNQRDDGNSDTGFTADDDEEDEEKKKPSKKEKSS